MLVRTLFELQVKYSHFLIMYQKEPRQACARLMDVSVLMALKYLRRASVAVNVDDSIKSFAEAEKVILKKYNPDEVNKISKYGFTGVPLDQAAIAIKQGEMYDTVYRLFSRSVHAVDHTEMLDLGNLEFDHQRENALRAQNELIFYIAGTLVACMLDQTNRTRMCGIDDGIAKVLSAFRYGMLNISEPPCFHYDNSNGSIMPSIT